MPSTDFAPWPCFSEEEIDAVTRVLRSNRVNYWTGQEGRQFETEFASFAGTKHAVALSNGTVALDLALSALDLGPGAEVIVTPRTFLASVSSIIRAGAVPIFADVCRDSQNFTTKSIEAVLTRQTEAILCVHLAGWPCEMDEIMELANSHDLRLIEDCAQAHGARYRGESVGSFGDVSAWSFCQDKIITTGGEGGMITTNMREIWSHVWAEKDHGKSFEAVYERQHPPGFRWIHESFGTNGRMTELQAAIGRMQLVKLPIWHRRRQDIANQIWSFASNIPGLRVPEVPEHIDHGAYKCYVFVRPDALKAHWNRDRIMAEINKRGVPCYSGSCSEVYLEQAFKGRGYRPRFRLENAKELGETSLMFLCHPTLTDSQARLTCDTIEAVMQLAVRAS